MHITLQDIRNSPEIRTYITQADTSLTALGFTEHSFPHVSRCADEAARILTALEYPTRQIELAQIAAYMHDIGNVINRADHALSGANMAFRILDRMGMPPEEIATVITAIGHHDDSTAFPVNAVAAAVILGDKTDVRRIRVRNQDFATFDIHDRVNYAVAQSEVLIDSEKEDTITLSLTIDTQVCAVMDYFEIFTTRMLLCRRAAEFFGLQFKLHINGAVII
jgi:metal-dependent HD superfamily phosphatase/phosphodiesterase